MTANIRATPPASPPSPSSPPASLPHYYAAARDLRAAGWDVPSERRPLLLAAIGHALDFETWRSLARRQGLSDEDAVALMLALVSLVASGGAPPMSLPS